MNRFLIILSAITAVLVGVIATLLIHFAQKAKYYKNKAQTAAATAARRSNSKSTVIEDAKIDEVDQSQTNNNEEIS